jgi:hypothetical protein
LVKGELNEEVTHLRSIDDIIYELDVIKRVLNEQEHTMDLFNKEIGLLFSPIFSPKDSGTQNTSSSYVHPALKVFDGLGAEARRVRESVRLFNDLLAQLPSNCFFSAYHVTGPEAEICNYRRCSSYLQSDHYPHHLHCCDSDFCKCLHCDH